MPKTLPKGHVSCLTSQFKYTPSASTDLAKTFARIRRRARKDKGSAEPVNVHALPVRKTG
jgi:hypothetical protein